jgi:hypothetical protein
MIILKLTNSYLDFDPLAWKKRRKGSRNWIKSVRNVLRGPFERLSLLLGVTVHPTSPDIFLKLQLVR